MASVVNDLLQVIELEQFEDNLFRGDTIDTGQGSLFGGLVAGQALRAAARTVPDDRMAHSLHAYFLRPGSVDRPVIYEVDRIRDGRGFTTRRVRAIQQGRAIFSLSASFQVLEEGPEHQSAMPDVPPPEEVATDEAQRLLFAERLPEPIKKLFLRERPMEIRPVQPANMFEVEPVEPVRHMWFRIKEPIDAPAAVHQALLAFCSDLSLMTTAMLPHGMSFWQPQVQSASIDHSLWFLRPCRVDEWLLYSMDSPSAAGARGFNRGTIYRQDGTMVAATAQEGLMRVLPKS